MRAARLVSGAVRPDGSGVQEDDDRCLDYHRTPQYFCQTESFCGSVRATSSANLGAWNRARHRVYLCVTWHNQKAAASDDTTPTACSAKRRTIPCSLARLGTFTPERRDSGPGHTGHAGNRWQQLSKETDLFKTSQVKSGADLHEYLEGISSPLTTHHSLADFTHGRVVKLSAPSGGVLALSSAPRLDGSYLTWRKFTSFDERTAVALVTCAYSYTYYVRVLVGAVGGG